MSSNTRQGQRHRAGIFSKYIDTFLKLKQEASSYPSGCDTKEDQKQFIERYRSIEGITLGPIEYNEGKRSYAKVQLNCLWGKLAQHPVMTKTEYIPDPNSYFQLIEDKDKIIQHVEIISQLRRSQRICRAERICQRGHRCLRDSSCSIEIILCVRTVGRSSVVF